MKFRTKIWSLPVSAALVLVVGVVISALIGARLSAGCRQAAQRRRPLPRHRAPSSTA